MDFIQKQYCKYRSLTIDFVTKQYSKYCSPAIDFITKQTWEWWFEWISTAILIVGVALTSFKVEPLNLYISLLGNAGWLMLGYLWRKWSLFIVEAIIVAIYFGGIYNTLITL